MSFKPAISRLVAKMRSDIRIAIVTLYCMCSFSLITPFAIYRFVIGDYLVGFADMAFVSLFVALMVVTWRPGKAELGADLTACAATTGVLFMVLMLGISPLWTFSTLVGNFVMARRPVAVIASFVLVLVLGLQIDAFTDNTERFTFIAVATMVSLFSLIFATRVSHRHGQLSNMLSLDPLTGALNRRALNHDLELITQSPIESSDCLVIMDLDEFKQLNDNYGHDAGDQVLIALAQIIALRTRDKDRFYRFGGEEFVLLLPRTSLRGAEVATENLRQILLEDLMSPGGQVTVSMGLAQRLPGESPDRWLKRADDALLEAKRTGKNKVVTAD